MSADKITCHECHLAVRIPPLGNRQKALCPRCGFQLTHYQQHGQQQLLAWALTSLVFLLLSMPFDFLSFSSKGQGQTMHLPGSLLTLIDNGYLSLAVIFALLVIGLPALLLSLIIYLILPLVLGKQPYGRRVLSQFLLRLLPWCMGEVFIIGVLVSLIKIMALAEVTLGLSFYTYILFALCFLISTQKLDQLQLSGWLGLPVPHIQTPSPSQSIQTTWALLLTAAIFLIPANTLPIMYTRLLGSDSPSTIMGGVIHLWHDGSYPIALVIFTASIFVPIGKLVILSWLNFSVQTGRVTEQKERMFWYRVTEFIGRWSMIDVFVVAVLAALIQLGNTMSIYPGPAVIAFCAVVVITMLAAMRFDSSLIWKQQKNDATS